MQIREDRPMQLIDGRFIYSASDLNNAVECRHLVELERLVALHERVRPEVDPATELLARKGDEHERHQLEIYGAQYGSRLVEFPTRIGRSIAGFEAAEAATVAAMDAGAAMIYQATFFDGTFLGRTDFLRRVERPSERRPWSYEVIDTKLALSPKPYYLIQLSNYSEHIARVSGSMPREMHVVLGSGLERSFHVDDFAAYYRRLKARFLERMASAPNATYPFETAHCVVCRWRTDCARQRSADDHLSLVAGIRRDQIAKLEAAGITTLAALSKAPDEDRPHGMREESFIKLRSQAGLQHRGRTEGGYFYELLDHDASSGFSLLPAPNDGDVFFDMEGDPLYAPDHGLEYLFGVYLAAEDRYLAFWARSDREERAAFEALIDFLTERRRAYPAMHVYHYAHYEQTALRRLMGRYGSRERELDDLLRGEVFVDLYPIVRQALRISQPSYSIKKLEAFYGMTRGTGVQRGDDSIVMFETWLFSGDDTILEDIERYNDDDCRSTYLLREWLLERRAEYAAARSFELAWFTGGDDREAPVDENGTALAAALLNGMEAPRSLAALRDASQDVRGRWLLGHLLEYDRREAKPAWWRLFDRRKNVDQLVEFDHESLGGLKLRSDIAPEQVKRSFIYTYQFPEQQFHLDDEPYCPDILKKAGDVIGIDEGRQLVRIKLTQAIVPKALRALVPGAPLENKAQRKALIRLAEAYRAGTLDTSHRATLDLLFARTPRIRGIANGAMVQPQHIDRGSLFGLASRLDESYLFIQGPPGSGKSTSGSGMIVDLLERGARVGIVAKGHKAIHNLLSKVEREAERRGVVFRGLQKYSSNGDSRYNSPLAHPMIETTTNNADFTTEPHMLAAGTPWLFPREELELAYDYLFIDEAGQMSLADALACSLAARNVVLLGDPLQLAQVSQGSHPIGTDLSILEHLLGAHETVPPDRGVFLDVSYRMHPAICTFISERVYEGRLHASERTTGNRIDAPGLPANGLCFIPVDHAANSRASNEEADRIVACVQSLLDGTVVVDERPERKMTMEDVLVVSPYNAQRTLLRRALTDAGLSDVRVGTVDKFQGQEAPVVLYSMATSSGDDLPRDMEFLFERNRFNVALSRAQVLSVLVCSPSLLDVRCSTPEQMRLVNLLCAFVEKASVQAEFAPLS